MLPPHKASVAEPLHHLHHLLDKEVSWSCGGKKATVFKAIKSLLPSESMLMQYNVMHPLGLTRDASLFGIRAVLSHQFPDGGEVPIAYFSRTLLPAERNYSQLDKEALVLVAGVTDMFTEGSVT